MGSDPTPSLPPITQAATRDRLAGHLGHLTDEQENALREFKEELKKEGVYEEDDEGNWNHDDTTLLRFLRARKFSVPAAVHQFTSTESWRRTHNVSSIYDDFPVPEFVESQQVYPQWTGRRDKAGLPVYVFKISGLTKDKVARYNKGGEERLEKRMIALYEHMVQFALPFCSDVPHDHQETPISATTTIVDISSVSLMRFWALRPHMQRASTLATANYAETLGTIYIVGAPNFFSTVWGWIAKWFDPGTVEKIFILSDKEVLPVLSRFIDPSSIPVQFGGSLPWTYGESPPLLDEEMKKTLGLEEMPTGSVRWGKKGFELKGTERTEEEVRKWTPKKENGVGAAEEKEEISPVVIGKEKTEEKEVVSEEKKEVVAEEKKEDVAEEKKEGQEEHTIWTAAKEEPAAPVKDLAATLEGTTL